uniref:Uncharacterized protein n=1 Tax=Octopus bimaculoides TaxID=37653 RepID=A0A0L8FWI2_OCTBM
MQLDNYSFHSLLGCDLIYYIGHNIYGAHYFDSANLLNILKSKRHILILISEKAEILVV